MLNRIEKSGNPMVDNNPHTLESFNHYLQKVRTAMKENREMSLYEAIQKVGTPINLEWPVGKKINEIGFSNL